jgi:RHS repeat-associated protein
MRSNAVCLCIAFAFFTCLGVGHGQVATGTYPYGTFDNKGIDTINVGNLNVHVAIPILSKSGRGIPFNYSLLYDNSVWSPTSVNGTLAWAPVNLWGWSVDTEASTGYVSYSSTTSTTPDPGGPAPIEGGPLPTCTTTTYSGWVYYDAVGTGHAFNGTTTQLIEGDDGSCPSGPSSFTETSADGSGYTISVSNFANATVQTANGKTITPAIVGDSSGTIQDLNGNLITVDASGNFTDATGTVALRIAGTAPSAHTFTYTDTTGTSRAVSVTYRTYTVQTAFGCTGAGVSEYGPVSTSLVDKVTLPDSSFYQFSYEATFPGSTTNTNVTGRVVGITLPAGGQIAYSYPGANNGIVCSDGTAAGLVRTIPATANSATSTWTYTRIPATGTSHTDVVDGLSNGLAYDFVAAANQPAGVTAVYYETQRQIYQGAASGTPVLKRQTCYNGTAAPCVTTALAVPFSQIDTYEVLDGLQEHGTTASYNDLGLQTELDTYDFGGASSRGPILSTETWSYLGGSVAGLLGGHTISDSSGVAAETSYAYDQGTLTASSGVPQHVAVSGARGNLTEVLQTTQFTTSGPSYVTTTNTYSDTGALLSSTGPNGTATASYDSTFSYAQGATPPTPASGVSETSSATFDTVNTGLLLSTTDPNGAKTTWPSYDALLRPTEVDSFDSSNNLLGKATTSYSSTLVDQKTYQSAGVFMEVQTQYDAYGRFSRNATSNGQSTNPWYQQDTCYDANENASFISYRYQGPGFGAGKVCSGAGDISSYDVLGRLTSVQRQNGESRSNTYLGRATQSTDESGVTRISQVDGLGRTSIVCEISSNSSMPGSGAPTSCGTDVAGTGFTTTYAYALASGTTTVTQGAQTRTFQTDRLGRTISVAEPESGTTTYSYVYNSTGLVVTRLRPQANQTSTTVLTTTTTQYDLLGRVLSVSYTDGTPTKNFVYDTSAGWGNFPQTNLVGRLSLAYVSTPTSFAGQVRSYDGLGRVTGLAECLPSECGNGADDRHLFYQYDMVGNLLSSSDGAGVTTSYTYTPTNEVQLITSSRSDATHPGTLVSNVQNGPNGPLSYSMGNGLTAVSTNDALGRVSGGFLCSGSTAASCSGGTQLYGFTGSWQGTRATGGCDTGMNQCLNYGYDEFNRLTSRTVTSGAAQNFTYVYDRYGNRWQQNVTAGSGPQPQFGIDVSNNQISSFAYDAAGNVVSDGSNTYAYDAEGNLIQEVVGSVTLQWVYDALNQQIVATFNGGPAQETVFDIAGKQASFWYQGTALVGKAYWGSTAIESYDSGSNMAFFQTRDSVGSERIETNASGTVSDNRYTLPFGDGLTNVSGSRDNSFDGFTGFWDGGTKATNHAQFREYSNLAGRWMQADPYAGSYDPSNPQSLNRYSYVLNSPLAYVDPTGLYQCDPDTAITTGDGNNVTVTVTAGACYFDDSDFLFSFAPDQYIARIGAPGGYVTPAISFTAPNKLTSYPFPANAVPCSTSTGVNFMAPPGFSVSNIAANGGTNGWSGKEAAVAQFGYYDYQRYVTGPGTFNFYYRYTPVANIAVGAYLSGVGVPQLFASITSDGYALFHSSNGPTAQQAQFRNLGYALASGKATYTCQSHP